MRGGSTKHQPISKREYKKRKKELLSQLESVDEQQPAIEFFELNDPSKFDQSTELDRRVEVIEEEAPIDILASPEDPPAPAPVPASPAPNAAAPPPPTPPAPAEETAEVAAADLAPVDTSINPLALGGSPAPASPSSETAAELLARLKADQPIQSQFASAQGDIDTDPFAAPTSDLVAPAQQPTTPPASPTTTAPLTTPASFTPSSSLDASPFATVAPAPEPAVVRPKSEPWSPPAPPPRGSNLDAMGADQPAPSPQPVPPAPTPAVAPIDQTQFEQAPLGQSPFEETPFEETSFEAFSLSNTVDEQPKRRSADTDESGQWIPPSLRGMAAEDERAPLPKRRS